MKVEAPQSLDSWVLGAAFNVRGSDNKSRTSRRVVRFHWFTFVMWHICTNHSTPRRRPVKSYSLTWLLVTTKKVHSKTFWRCICCSLCFINYGALPFSFPSSGLLYIGQGPYNLLRWEIWRWVYITVTNAEFCPFDFLQRSWCRVIFYRSVLNFQIKVTKIDGLNLLSREATVENSCGLLENFTAMPT